MCDTNTGRCDCIANVVGERCDQCDDGFWGTPGNCQSNSSSQVVIAITLLTFL